MILAAHAGNRRCLPDRGWVARKAFVAERGRRLRVAKLGEAGGAHEQAIVRAALAGDQPWFRPVPELEDRFRLVAPRELRPSGRDRRRGTASLDTLEDRKGIDQMA